jgi:hypothetical protein
MAQKSLLSIVSMAAVAGSLVACVVDNDGPHHYRHEPDPGPVAQPSPPSSSSSSSGSTAAPVDPGTASTAAMLVEVDSNQTMNAQPGEGVGVFVEYNKGGHWHVWWTCDTNQGDHQSCDFSVSISAATGNITNVDATELAGGLYSAPTPSRLEARSTTTTEVKGFRFDTDAGAVITLEATLASAQGDIKDGSFLFFVQDGKVNGGFAGKLTNPLRLQGNVP